MAILAPYVFWQEFDNNGEPLAGGKVYTYAAGTTTPKRTFTDADETAENTNPIILDSAGRADIWLDEGAYKFVITDSNDVTIKTKDDFAGDAAGAIVSYDVSTNLNLTAIYDNANIYATSTFTINLLPAADAEDGFQFRVYNEGVGVITIDPNSSETINGASTITIPASCWALVYCTGTEWFAFVVNTMALQNDSSVDINGGSIDAVTLGTNSPVTEAQVDNININGNTISSTDTNGNIVLSPNGSGFIDVATSLISNVVDPSGAQDAATKAYVDAHGIVQQVRTSTGTVATGTTIIPDDNTIPQITEGTEFMTLAITPTNASNILVIDVVCNLSTSAASNTGMVAALFQDATSNALIASKQGTSQNIATTVAFRYTMVSGTTSSTTFRVRGGQSIAGTTTFNGQGGSGIFGGRFISSITITEIKV